MSVKTKSIDRNFDNNTLAMQLFGPHHSYIAEIEKNLNIVIHTRGNDITITGETDDVDTADEALTGLYNKLEKGLDISKTDVEAMLRLANDEDGKVEDAEIVIRTKKKFISPRSAMQAKYLQAIDDSELVFGQGPAGTGKTYLAVAKAVERLVRGDVDRIILSRPAVEAGEQLGFLPGDMREKVDPYLRPLYDALHDMLPESQVTKRLENGDIEVAPLAFMRGRTLSNAFVILDEAQNTTPVQMKMFLTRLGENSRMVITGDLSQVDLPRGTRSGMRDAIDTLADVKGVGFITFDDTDVVRHKLVGRIVKAYNAVEKSRHVGERYESREK